LYLWLIILSVISDVPVDSETVLITNSMNLKIKSTQSFGCAYRGRVCVHIGEYSYVYKYLRLYYVSQKKIWKEVTIWESRVVSQEIVAINQVLFLLLIVLSWLIAHVTQNSLLFMPVYFALKIHEGFWVVSRDWWHTVHSN
jgi:hypothetical protein